MWLMAHVTLFLITFDLVEIFKDKKVNASVGLDLRVGMFQNSREGSVSAKTVGSGHPNVPNNSER